MIADRYEQILEQIVRAAQSCGRDAGQIRLVVVTKGHPLESVQAAVAAGARLLGESYVDEALEKITSGKIQDRVEWHMIGHIQSRKSNPAAAHFDCIHSLDREKLAVRLDRHAGQANRRLPVLLECNVSGEASKYGWPAWREESWPDLLEPLARVLALPHLHVRGLMTMAPYFADPQQARPYFNRLRRLRDFLALRFPDADWSELSMGMSGDFLPAIQEGATLLRIGTAIMGPRPDLPT